MAADDGLVISPSSNLTAPSGSGAVLPQLHDGDEDKTQHIGHGDLQVAGESIGHDNSDVQDQVIDVVINTIQSSRHDSMWDSANNNYSNKNNQICLRSPTPTAATTTNDRLQKRSRQHSNRSSRRSSKGYSIATPRRPSSNSVASSSSRRLWVQSHRSLQFRSGDALEAAVLEGEEPPQCKAVYGGLYGRSTSSCGRHLRMGSASPDNDNISCSNEKSHQHHHRYGGEQCTTTMPRPAMATKTGGVSLSFLAFRDKYTDIAVREAKAQLLLANHSTTRLEFELILSRRKYKRLEADMIRSRLEVADTLAIVEMERKDHTEKLSDAERHQAELEGAVRAADEILRQLTIEAKSQRRAAEQREASLMARLESIERKLKESEAERRREKLSTWATVARETERSAGRERYRMTAFLQRYIVENEYLRASVSEAEEEARSLRERLQQSEEKLARIIASATALHRQGGPNQRFLADSTRLVGPGAETEGIDERQSPGDVAGGPGGGIGIGGGGSQVGGAGARKNTDIATVTHAELAARRLKARLGDNDQRRRRSGSGGRKGIAPARGQLRAQRGRIAELSSLLAATEDERDSLASVLILAEKQMERMAIRQEEAAMAMGWKIGGTGGEGRKGGVGWGEERRRQRRTGGGFERSGVVNRQVGAVVGGVLRSTETARDTLNTTALDTTTSEMCADTAHSTALVPAVSEGVREQSEAVVVAAAYGSRGSEIVDLKRRVRDLEMLLRAAELEHRESEQEKQKLLFMLGAETSMSISRESEATATTAGRSCCFFASASTGAHVPDEETVSFGEGNKTAHPGAGAGAGNDASGCLESQQQRRWRPATEDYGMIQEQLAWVLGLPEDRARTDHELLAEVMHLVVERGAARVDAATLRTHLEKIDEAQKSSYLNRLAAFVAPESGGVVSSGGEQGCSLDSRFGDHGLSESDAPASHGEYPLPSGAGGGGSSGNPPCNSDSGYGNERASARAWARDHLDSAGQPIKNKSSSALYHRSSRRNVANTEGKRSDGVENLATGRKGMAEMVENQAAGSGGVATTATTKLYGMSDEQPGESSLAATERLSAVKIADAGSPGRPPASAWTSMVPQPPGSADVGDGHFERASFPRTLQGRVVSIDIFCSKVPSFKPKEGEEGDDGEPARIGGILASDEEYQIRIEAYDPKVLKRHMLMVYENDIKRCFASHPHLYTLGPHRRRVHQSLAERLTLMSEERVRAKLQQIDGGKGRDPSTSPPASAGSTALPGGRGGAAPVQLLVLIGDSGEIILAENNPVDSNTAAPDAGRQHVHRFAQGALLQIEKEEEVVEGAVFQYEAPLQNPTDPLAAELARALSTMDSFHSSQEEDADSDDYEDEDEDAEGTGCPSEEDENEEDHGDDDHNNTNDDDAEDEDGEDDY